MPEAGAVALPETDDGEIAARAAASVLKQLKACDALAFGPAMVRNDDLPGLVGAVIGRPHEGLSLLLDAGVIKACGAGLERSLAGHGGRVGHDAATRRDGGPAGLRAGGAGARSGERRATAATRFGAVMVLKDRETFVAAPGGDLVRQESPCIGLGTAGSGDVLAGVIGGLLARGADPLAAAAWGVWLHGEAGRAAGARIGATGFLARELLPELPRLSSG